MQLQYVTIMKSLTKCKKTINKSKTKYNDDQVKQIRDFLYKIGELGYEVFKLENAKDGVSLNSTLFRN